MNRQIEFRGKLASTGIWVYGFLYQSNTERWITDSVDVNISTHKNLAWWKVCPETVGQFTGITDRNGVKIYEGDKVLIRTPERLEQTHTGDNIPLGSYTEPMEPVISEQIAVVEYRGHGFTVDGDDDFVIWWPTVTYTLKDAKEGFSGHWYDYDVKESTWSDPEEGDLQYLLGEYNLKSESELVEYLGVFVTGNIHDQQS